ARKAITNGSIDRNATDDTTSNIVLIVWNKYPKVIDPI
ncbi:unnamed protein product, partial [Rotaria sp. Silwood1]